MRGVPINVVQELLGHTDIRTTMRYAHVAPSTLRSAIDLLNPAQQLVSEDFRQPAVNQWLEMQRKEFAQKSMVSEKSVIA
jgi:glutamine synthetase